MEVVDEDEEYVSDFEAFYHVGAALNGVAMAPNLVGPRDRDQYGFLVSVVDPTEWKHPEQEALLVTALKALTGAISKINIAFHGSLLNSIFSLSLWNYGSDTRKTILEMIVNLAAVPDKYVYDSLHMLVTNFVPPKRLRVSMNHKWFADERSIHHEIYDTLHCIVYLAPLAPKMLKDIIGGRMPKVTDPKEVIVMFVKSMLELESHDLGKFLRSILLTKVVELLVDLDVNIKWEDILQEGHTEGVFGMELEDVEENARGIAGVGTKKKQEVFSRKCIY